VCLSRLDTGVMSSNPTQGMHVCPRLPVLCCPVDLGHRADPSSKETFPNVEMINNFRSNCDDDYDNYDDDDYGNKYVL
jgi:hypothetical protein